MFKVYPLTPEVAQKVLLSVEELREQTRITKAKYQIAQAEHYQKVKEGKVLVKQQKEQFEHEKLSLPIQRLIRWNREGGLYHIGDRR